MIEARKSRKILQQKEDELAAASPFCFAVFYENGTHPKKACSDPSWVSEFHYRVVDEEHRKYVIGLNERELETWIPTCFTKSLGHPTAHELFEFLHGTENP